MYAYLANFTDPQMVAQNQLTRFRFPSFTWHLEHIHIGRVSP